MLYASEDFFRKVRQTGGPGARSFKRSTLRMKHVPDPVPVRCPAMDGIKTVSRSVRR